ncbi:MAG: excinuclease ABC subunit UvrC [Bacteroidales bacterium]
MKTDKESIEQKIKNILSVLPHKPGVYQYFDEKGTIIYVGKAKNLSKRVKSYFNKVHDSPKTNILVRKIADIKYIVVDTEEDALHLENSLIKEHKPRYNVLLKDDKTYPWICIKKEAFPRVFQTRKVIKDGSSYFGPYSNVYIAKVILELIRQLYPIRTCKLALDPESLRRKNYKVCLEYHIKNCMGCCESLISEEEYNEYIRNIREILKGNTEEISNHLKEKMIELASELRFEEAQELKIKYDLIENYKSKSIIVHPSITNLDVFTYDEDDTTAYINYLHIVNGSIVQAYTIEYKKRVEELKEEILSLGIMEIRSRFKKLSREIVIPFPLNIDLKNIVQTVPKLGDKKKLLELSEQNVRQYKVDKYKQAEKLNPEQRSIRIMTRLQKDLGLDELPMHIECFDNSNIQGTNPVAACVVFKKAKPSKKDYRHFNIKTVEGPNDFASMQEIVYRRYKRLKEEGEPLPNLIIIDGGKGQLNAAVEILDQLGLRDKIQIVGLAKRLEEIFFPGDSIPLYLDKNSESLKLIQQLRDEAHRFGITFHRDKRSKSQTTSVLDEIKGIGPQTKQKILSHFKSIKRLEQAEWKEVEDLIGTSKAQILKNGLTANSKR